MHKSEGADYIIHKVSKDQFQNIKPVLNEVTYPRHFIELGMESATAGAWTDDLANPTAVLFSPLSLNTIF
ncbi:MAG: hypothetical protein ACFFBD_12020 [Candidatus Hodarchaeota archaeon]